MAKINFAANLHGEIIDFAKSELEYYFRKILAPECVLNVSILSADKPLRFDGYTIQSDGFNIAIAATQERGILHGAYELLRELGCNFLLPSKAREVLPFLNDSLPSVNICKEPFIEWRGMCLYNTTAKTLSETLDTVDYMAKNGYNFLLTSIHREDDTDQGDHAILWDEIGEQALPQLNKRGIAIDMSEHSTDYYFPREELFAQHPEWFALLSGVRCATQICYSNLDAVEVYANKMAEFVADKPWFKFFGIWPLDGGNYCQCEHCQNPLTIYNATKLIAKIIGKVRADLVVEHLAYTPQSFARPNEAAPSNLSVLVCSERGKAAQEWAQATKNGGGAFFFDYSTGDNYRWRSNLWINPKYIADTVNIMLAYGYRGIVSLYLPITAWWQASINYWYMRELYYNPVADLQSLTDKLSSQLFGKETGDEMAAPLWNIITKMQSTNLWPRYPHCGDVYSEHITQRNTDLNNIQKEQVVAMARSLLDTISNVKAPRHPVYKNNLTYVKDYIALQIEYLKGVVMYNAEADSEAAIELYFQLLEKYEQEGKPYISAQYARWRITGRDNLCKVKQTNAYAAKSE